METDISSLSRVSKTNTKVREIDPLSSCFRLIKRERGREGRLIIKRGKNEWDKEEGKKIQGILHRMKEKRDDDQEAEQIWLQQHLSLQQTQSWDEGERMKGKRKEASLSPVPGFVPDSVCQMQSVCLSLIPKTATHLISLLSCVHQRSLSHLQNYSLVLQHHLETKEGVKEETSHARKSGKRDTRSGGGHRLLSLSLSKSWHWNTIGPYIWLYHERLYQYQMRWSFKDRQKTHPLNLVRGTRDLSCVILSCLVINPKVYSFHLCNSMWW